MKRTIASISLTSVMFGVLVGSAAAADSPVTLRLGVSDDAFNPSMPAVVAFTEAASRLSGGSVAVEPEFGAGDATAEGFEVGTGRRLISGDLDVALVAGRAWHTLGATGLDVLQAPFLIDSDGWPRPSRVTRSRATSSRPCPTSASPACLWPEDLRHPAAFEDCIGPITRPDHSRV